MDRLAVFKVLADSSRYAIYAEVSRAAEALTTTEVAERLGLHPSTVRLHLEKLRDVGLLTMSSDHHGTVGRPQHCWSVAPAAPSLGLEPDPFRLLAHLLAEVAGGAAGTPGGIAAVGRVQGRQRAGGARLPRTACLQAVMDELADLGFDPALEAGQREEWASIAFTRCPFRELATLYPDIICQLHRGVTEGILAAATARTGVEAHLEGFASLVDEDPCRAEVSVPG